MPDILSLPNELIDLIFENLASLHDARSLSSIRRLFRTIWNASYRCIAREILQYEDSLLQEAIEIATIETEMCSTQPGNDSLSVLSWTIFFERNVDLCDEAYEALEKHEWGRSTPKPSPSPATWYFVRECTLAFHRTELRVDLHSRLLSPLEETLLDYEGLCHLICWLGPAEMSIRQGTPLHMQSASYYFAWEDEQHHTDGWEYAINVSAARV